MQFNLLVLKDESIEKLEKAHKSIKKKFNELLSFALDTAIFEIDGEKRDEVEMVLNDILNDEFNKQVLSYTKCMNKVCDLVANELGK